MELQTIYIAGEAVQIGTRWEVCPRCAGAGSHGNPAFDGAPISDFDEEFLDGYFSGDFDVSCAECGGRTTVKVDDLSSLTPEQFSSYEIERRQEAEDRHADYITYRAEMGLGC